MSDSNFMATPQLKLLEQVNYGRQSMWGLRWDQTIIFTKGFIKIDGIDGESGPAFMKPGDIKGEAIPLPSDRKNRLRQMGLSIQGASQLESGKLITSQKDMRIIAHIVSNSV